MTPNILEMQIETLKRIRLLAILLFTFVAKSYSQSVPFQIAIEPISINGLVGIQAFAWGQHNQKWLIIGGRLDGLHRRQPFAAFDEAGHNNRLLVIDPVAQQKWSASISSLPVSIQEQLSSTNMEFYQEGDFLYLIGGYGFSNAEDDHITYPNLCAVNVPKVIDAVIKGTSATSYFRQIKDTMFAVTGGYLNKIYDTYYLTGGQKFIGRYNPMGPTHGPGFIQEYTNSIRKFLIHDDGTNLPIIHLPSMYDEANLHRRDYNAVPQIMPNGQEGITAFSGVFQADIDLPFLNSVNIDSSGYSVNNDFSQYYNHYHCAHIPIYSSSKNEMHTVFFGGIAQYYDNSGVLVQDNNVPFVKTIARVTRDANGKMIEYKLPIELPSLLGASSEFIPVETVPHFNNGVLNLDAINSDTTLLGYIYGGISSTAANIFFTNTGTESSASSQLFKVSLIKNSTSGTHRLNHQSNGTLQLQIYPNSNYGHFIIKFNLSEIKEVKLTISDSNGKIVENEKLKNLLPGENNYAIKIKNLSKGGNYFVTLATKDEKITQKIIIER